MPKARRANFQLRKAVSLPGIAGKRGRTFKAGEEDALVDYVGQYNDEAEKTAESDAPVQPIDLDATLARPGTVAVDADAGQDELDHALAGIRGLTVASGVPDARFGRQFIPTPADADDDEDDGPVSRRPRAAAAKKGAGAKRARSR